MQSSHGVSSTEAKIPLYRALRAIATEQVDVDEIRESVEEAVTQAVVPLATAVENLPVSIGVTVEHAIQPAIALIRDIHSQIFITQELSDEIDEGCIQDAFEFMRTLNQIDDLIADQKFTEAGTKKDNSVRLENYKKTNTKLYTGCIAILENRSTAGQIDEGTKAAWEREFDSLFEPIGDDFQIRAQRLLDVQSFRRKILDFFFFSGRSQQQPVDLEQDSITS